MNPTINLIVWFSVWLPCYFYACISEAISKQKRLGHETKEAIGADHRKKLHKCLPQKYLTQKAHLPDNLKTRIYYRACKLRYTPCTMYYPLCTTYYSFGTTYYSFGTTYSSISTTYYPFCTMY